MEFFRQAQWAYKFSDPRIQQSFVQAVKGTPLMPRDLFLSAVSGRLMLMILPDRTKVFPMAAVQNVSASMDAVAQLPGQMLVRGNDWWQPIDGGNVNYVLTSNGPTEAPTWQPASGTATTSWGDIVGTLSDQADLQSALDAKADLAGGNTFTGAQVVDGTFTVDPAHTTNLGPQVWLLPPNAGSTANLFIADYLGNRLLNIASGPSAAPVTYWNADYTRFSTLDNSTLFLTLEVGATGFSVPATVPNDPFGAGWNGSLEIPTKDAIYDAFSSYVPTVPVFTATVNGLAPASGGGTANFLRADGTWDTPPGSTYGVFTPTVDGLAPASGGGAIHFLRADGSWATPAGTGVANPTLQSWYGGHYPAAAVFPTIFSNGLPPTLTFDADIGLVLDGGTPANDISHRVAGRAIVSPTFDWDLEAHWSATMNQDGFTGTGIYLVDNIANRALAFMRFSNNTLVIGQLSMPTGNSGGVFTGTLFGSICEGIWTKIAQVGTNLIFYVSGDGKHWIEVYRQTATAWLTNHAQYAGPGVFSQTTHTSHNFLTMDYWNSSF